MTFEASPNESPNHHHHHNNNHHHQDDNNIHRGQQQQIEDHGPQRAIATNDNNQVNQQINATSANLNHNQVEEAEVDNEHLEEINFDYDNEDLINNDPIFEQLFGNPNQFRRSTTNQQQQANTADQALANLQQQISGLMLGIGERPAVPTGGGEQIDAEYENLDKDIDLINEAMNKLDQQTNQLQSRFRELLMAIVEDR